MSDRPSRIEAASASLPTIGVVIVAACGIVWALGEMIGDVRADIRVLKSLTKSACLPSWRK